MLREFALSKSGQAILLIAAAMGVFISLAGLAIDASNYYLVRRQAQNAVDFAAFAAGKQLALSSYILTSPPVSNDVSVKSAHDFASLNGFNTTYSTACDSSAGGAFKAVWFDTAVACSASAGFINKIQVNVPAQSVNGFPVPIACAGTAQYSCFQVTLTHRVDTYFGRAFGVPSLYFTVTAIVFTTPAISAFSMPPPVAVYLYQPQSGCVVLTQQCFDESAVPSRGQLTCLLANCPTFLVNNNVQTQIFGVDGMTLSPQADYPALQSAGDMVIQQQTVFCDPYNGAVCSTSNAIGTKGFALAGGSKLYCNAFNNGGTANGLVPCSNTNPPGSLDHLAGKETSYSSATWSPVVDTSGLHDCGALILNGDTVQNSFTVAGGASCWSTSEPYVVQPGRYQYIVINHGTYEFETGLYDFTGSGPVNTLTAGSYHANGIDHKNEQSGINNDWDLCTGGQPNSCPLLTAALWIGHGSGWYGAFSNGTAGSCTGGTGGTTGGGGDKTIISGSSVTFRFESGAGGFVSTNEVESILLSAPGIGFSTEVSGAPLLFDLENNNFIHLDAHDNSQFTGIIFQKQTATAGGVEVDPSLGHSPEAAIQGQILAYSLATFGANGPAVDFRTYYGGAALPGVQTSGKAEASLVSSASMTQAVDGSGNPVNGWETLTINYTDEWALDAYSMYLKLNNAQPVFFSAGIWNPTPAGGAALPPATNNPGDSNAAYPAASAPSPYTQQADPITLTNTWWTMTYGSGANQSTFDVHGNWTWGHEQDIAGSTSKTNRAVIRYTFPVPAGTSTSVTIFLTDGDHCGDYYLVTASFTNIGQVGGGQQSSGSVGLVR